MGLITRGMGRNINNIVQPAVPAFIAGSGVRERVIYKEHAWPVIRIKKILTKDEQERVKVFILEMIEV